MKLLRERNSWAPTLLRSFHQRFGLHEAPSIATAAQPVAVVDAAEDIEPHVEAETVGAGSGTMSR
jgi:hypothetical protein